MLKWPLSAALPLRRRFLAMGTEVTVTLAVPRRRRKRAEAAIAEAQALLGEFGRDGWAWGSGVLAQFNRELAAGAIARIPAGLQTLFSRAWEIHQRSGGLFEPRIASLVHLWGFDDIARLRLAPPPQAEIDALLAALRAAPAYDGGPSYGPAPGVGWDLGGIGKGYIVDAALELLRVRGFPDASVDAGGNLAVRGTRSDRAWRVGVRDPRSGEDAPRLLVWFEARDEAVITHGDDQRFFEYQGRRYAHVLDPCTGMPVQGLRSLTVVHQDATFADGAGAALFVAGRDGWRRLARQLGIDQVLAVFDDGTIQATAPLAPRLTVEPGVHVETVP
jgi:thiamine biosynthesis lipoprotein